VGAAAVAKPVLSFTVIDVLRAAASGQSFSAKMVEAQYQVCHSVSQ
jgi:hypothetical protein